MNTFDYIQISVPKTYIKNPNIQLFNRSIDTDGCETYSLRSGKSKISSHSLKLIFNIGENDATIGFSSKILGSNYPDLISENNIEDCLNLLCSKYKLCESLEVENIIESARCQKLEVTKDIVTQKPLSKVNYQNITNLVTDSKKWKTLTTENGYVRKNGFGVMRSKGESIIFYGKEAEMKLPKNEAFVSEFNLEDRFAGATRIEIKLNNSKSIRNRFHTDRLNSILKSDKDPSIEIIEEVFASAQSKNTVAGNFVKSQRDRERLSYAKEFNFDFGAISADIKKRAGKNWKREFEPIKELCKMENKEIEATLDLIENIKSLLSKRNN